MAYDSRIKNKAFKLFCVGKSMKEISRSKGMPSETTISAWRRQEEWDKRSREINNKTNAKLAENIVDFKSSMITELCDIKRQLLEEMPKCLNPTKDKIANTLIKLQQQELLLRGEATEHKKIDGDIVNRNLDFTHLTTDEIRELLKNED